MTDSNPYAPPKSDLGDDRSRDIRPLTPKVLGPHVEELVPFAKENSQ